jgi:hypothetical protein
MTLKLDLRSHVSRDIPFKQGGPRRTRTPKWGMERVEAEDLSAVLQDALESADDENNVATLNRILEHLASGPLDPLPFSTDHPD